MMTHRDFDLILMDCQMPDIDGFEATRQIRTMEAARGSKRTPIIALTANAIAGGREDCLRAGMDDYLAKPYSGEQLSSALARWLPASPPGPGTAALPAPEALPSAPPPAQQGDSPISRAILDKIRAISTSGGDALVRQVVAAYLKSAPAQMAALNEAFDKNDQNALAKNAHALKSSSFNVGAETLGLLLSTLEKNSPLSDKPAFHTQIEAARIEFSRVRLELEKLRDSM